jgi:thymidylate synthase
MKAYLNIMQKILDSGFRKANRTGVDALAIAGAMFEHDMEEGFPLLTTKKVPFNLVASELKFFIRGITDFDWHYGDTVIENHNPHTAIKFNIAF